MLIHCLGRKTFESIGRPLPGRHNIVISRQQGLVIEGVSCVTSFDEALLLIGEVDEVVVIGGGQLYQALLPRADKLYLTQIDLDVEGDTYFPFWDDGSWLIEASETHSNDNGLRYTFINLAKKL